jgi:phosphopantetheinyl transferase
LTLKNSVLRIFYSDTSGVSETRARLAGRSDKPGSAFAASLLARAVFLCGGDILQSPSQEGERFLPEIKTNENGKPFFPGLPDLCFSYSHTPGFVLCAVSDAPVGADCERVRPLGEKFLRRFASDRELERYDFFELWTMRESLYKLRGRGNLLSSDFTVNGGEIILPDDPDIRFFPLAGLREAHGCAACVCTGAAKAIDELTEVDIEELCS